MSSPTASTAQHHFVIRKHTAYCCYLVASSTNGIFQHHGTDISLGIKSAGNILNSVSLDICLLFSQKQAKPKSQSHTDIPPIWPLLFLFLRSSAYFALNSWWREGQHHRLQGEVPCLQDLHGRKLREQMWGKNKGTFLYFELKLYKLSGGTWKH